MLSRVFNKKEPKLNKTVADVMATFNQVLQDLQDVQQQQLLEVEEQAVRIKDAKQKQAEAEAEVAKAGAVISKLKDLCCV